MAEDEDKSQRKIYILPKSLIQRIAAYQKANDIVSEAEAVRSLIDRGLRGNERPVDMMRQAASVTKDADTMIDAAKEYFVGHPMVKSMVFNDDDIEITFKNQEEYAYSRYGNIFFKDSDGDWVDLEVLEG